MSDKYQIVMKSSIDCIDCGKNINVFSPNVKRCEQCRMIHKKKYYKERYNNIVNNNHIFLSKNCIDCGMVIQGKSQKRCSDCKKEHNRKRDKERYKVRYIPTKRETNCIDCGILIKSFKQLRCDNCRKEHNRKREKEQYNICSNRKRKAARKHYFKLKQQMIINIINSISESLKCLNVSS